MHSRQRDGWQSACRPRPHRQQDDTHTHLHPPDHRSLSLSLAPANAKQKNTPFSAHDPVPIQWWSVSNTNITQLRKKSHSTTVQQTTTVQRINTRETRNTRKLAITACACHAIIQQDSTALHHSSRGGGEFTKERPPRPGHFHN